jgi:hypothetical protein
METELARIHLERIQQISEGTFAFLVDKVENLSAQRVRYHG